MAAVTGVYVVKDATFTLETVEYNNQITVARLVPDTPIQQLRTLIPDGVISDVDSPIWTLELTLVQKNNTGGLARALRTLGSGIEADCVLAPKNLDGEDQAAFTIISMLPPFGGEQGSFPTAEMVFPVKGQPVFSEIAD